MAPFYVEHMKSLSARVEHVVNNESETMDSKTTMEVVVIVGKFTSIGINFKYFHFPWCHLHESFLTSTYLYATMLPTLRCPLWLFISILKTDTVSITVIFLALLLSLYVFVWKYPTSLNSLRAVPVSDTTLPVPNTAPPGRSHGRSSPVHLREKFLAIYYWWLRASYNRTMNIPPITHHEHSVARSPSVRADTGPPTPATLAFTFSGATSSIDTTVNNNEASDAIELHKLDGSKDPSVSSLAVTDDADINNVQLVVTTGEPIVRVYVVSVSEASEAPLVADCSAVEVDVTDFDRVALGHQTLR